MIKKESFLVGEEGPQRFFACDQQQLSDVFMEILVEKRFLQQDLKICS